MKVPLNDVDNGRWVIALDVWEKTGLCKETGLCGGCRKETGLCNGRVEGDRSLQWVCVRRQVCAVGVLKEIGLCSGSV